MLNWRGIDGVPAAEPLAARPPLAAGAKETSAIPLRHAGTFLCDLRLLGDGQARPSAARALIVAESEPVAVDRDEVFLIEDWRLRPDGTAIAPGIDPKDTTPLYTVNGRTTPDIPARAHERLRLRFINGCQRAVIAVKIEGHDVRVMALDGQPAEPFPARNGAHRARAGRPGRRLHRCRRRRRARHRRSCCMTARRPARSPGWSPPANHRSGDAPLPRATRCHPTACRPSSTSKTPCASIVTLGGRASRLGDGLRTSQRPAAPAFRAKAGRTVVLALTNRGEISNRFHLHGHHFRLLDRLDDGWKPFWLDTIAIEPGQTQRIAFAADHAGRWLMETIATEWAAPRLVRRYSVE